MLLDRSVFVEEFSSVGIGLGGFAQFPSEEPNVYPRGNPEVRLRGSLMSPKGSGVLRRLSSPDPNGDELKPAKGWIDGDFTPLHELWPYSRLIKFYGFLWMIEE